ncbi:hypothetical protein [Geodermatophilus sp. SYSU D00766]
MEPQQPITHRTDPDDVEGHADRRPRWNADAERDETDDVGGHGSKGRTGYVQESDDVEGHSVIGGLRPTHPKARDEDDDVAGHLSGALGSKKKTEDAG